MTRATFHLSLIVENFFFAQKLFERNMFLVPSLDFLACPVSIAKA